MHSTDSSTPQSEWERFLIGYQDEKFRAYPNYQAAEKAKQKLFYRVLLAGGLEDIDQFTSDRTISTPSGEFPLPNSWDIRRALEDAFFEHEYALSECVSDKEQRDELLFLCAAASSMEHAFATMSRTSMLLLHQVAPELFPEDSGIPEKIPSEREWHYYQIYRAAREATRLIGKPKGGRKSKGVIRKALIKEVGRIFDIATNKEFEMTTFADRVRSEPNLPEVLALRRVDFTYCFLSSIEYEDGSVDDYFPLRLPKGFTGAKDGLLRILGRRWKPPAKGEKFIMS